MNTEKNISTRIIHKHDTEANWNKATNFIPKEGELIVYDKDQNHSQIRLKMGDGTTKVNDLPFSIDEILIGTTEEITPSQVKAMMDEGKSFAITHTDSTYGAILLNDFVYSQAVGSYILSSTTFQVANVTFCAQLFGNFNSNTWEFSAFELAKKDDLPTAFYVTVTKNGIEYIADKNIEEIEAAYQLGRPLYCYHTSSFDNTTYCMSLGARLENGAIFAFGNASQKGMATIVIWSHGVQVLESEMVQYDDIPTKVSQLENDKGFATEDKLPTAFYITVDPSTGTVDKTDSEIEAAYQAEKPIYCLYPANDANIRCPLTTKFEIEGIDVWVFSMVGLLPLESNAMAGYIMVTNGHAAIESNTLANSEDIPTVPESLKNPNKLIVTDGFLYREEYDGSSEITVQIPIVPSALKNPHTLTINGTSYDGSETKTISGLATETYVDGKVASMVDSAPETLNTLNELAAALGDDPNFATTIANQIGNKVDKVSGKGLSTNDYTTTEKNKLAGIAEGANKTIVDTYLNSTSTNPVQNKVVKDALDKKPGKRNPDNSAETFNYAGNYAKGQFSHAEGWNTEAIGNSAHAEGVETVAMGDYSHAEGHGTTYILNHQIHISGEANTLQYQIIDEEINQRLKVYSIIRYDSVYAQVRKIENNIITLSNTLSSEPLENVTAYIVTNYGAIGMYSHVEGTNTLANGESSHAEGYYTSTLGSCSHAEGYHTIAASNYQHVQGRNNIEDSENKYVHIIGNGALNLNRSNAHTVDWEGNAWYAGDVYVGSTSGTNKDEGSKKLATEDQVNNKVDKISGKGLSTNDYTTADKTKLDNTNIAYGTCSTAAATAEKVVVLNGNTQWSLKTGSIIMVEFDISNSAENVKINVNNTGAYPIWYNNAEYTGTGTAYTGYANRTITYMFNGTHYVWITASYDANSTYTNAALGQGYATCSTAAATTAKVGTLSSYKLVTGGIVSVAFTNAVPANATLNINSTGAKSIYFRGAKITGDVIKAGDVATFVYSTYYRLISIDRWQNDISTMQTQINNKLDTDDVNSLIDAKLAEIINAEEVAF